MLVVSIEANRLFENGPFLATIISMDDTAQGIWSTESLIVIPFLSLSLCYSSLGLSCH